MRVNIGHDTGHVLRKGSRHLVTPAAGCEDCAICGAPCFAAREKLSRTAYRLIAQVRGRNRVDIVVVDSGSHLGTLVAPQGPARGQDSIQSRAPYCLCYRPRIGTIRCYAVQGNFFSTLGSDDFKFIVPEGTQVIIEHDTSEVIRKGDRPIVNPAMRCQDGSTCGNACFAANSFKS